MVRGGKSDCEIHTLRLFLRSRQGTEEFSSYRCGGGCGERRGRPGTAVEDGCAIGLVDAARDARGLEQVRGLLKASGLGLDADVELFATARDASGRLLACLGLAATMVGVHAAGLRPRCA